MDVDLDSNTTATNTVTTTTGDNKGIGQRIYTLSADKLIPYV